MMSAATCTIRVAVGSKNPTKLNSAKAAIERAFPSAQVACHGYDVPSGVSDQPMGDEETRVGAFNRARAAAAAFQSEHGALPDFSVGLEGGCAFETVDYSAATVVRRSDNIAASVDNSAVGNTAIKRNLLCFAYMAVHAPSVGKWGYAKTGTFVLPSAVAELVEGGMELGHADDKVFSRTDSKRSNGAVGLLTGDLITRTDYYEHAMLLALIPFMPQSAPYYAL